eukprot:gene9732-8229_t
MAGYTVFFEEPRPMREAGRRADAALARYGDSASAGRRAEATAWARGEPGYRPSVRAAGARGFDLTARRLEGLDAVLTVGDSWLDKRPDWLPRGKPHHARSTTRLAQTPLPRAGGWFRLAVWTPDRDGELRPAGRADGIGSFHVETRHALHRRFDRRPTFRLHALL